MEKDSPPGKIIEFAIEKEEAAQKFYLAHAGRVSDASTQESLGFPANEELRHKETVEYLYANTAFPQTSGG